MPRATRPFAALPDAITAGVFLWLWIAPLSLGPRGVANAMLVMLVEFILVHASGFLGATALAEGIGTRKRLLGLAGFGLFYILFIAAWAWSFGEWWPFLAFGWLLLGKAMAAVGRDGLAPDRVQRMQSEWALGAMAYLGGVFATLFLPLPRLGITPAVRDGLGLPGSGEWIDRPHTVIAFGVLYFGFLAVAKWRDWRLPATGLPARRPPAG